MSIIVRTLVGAAALVVFSGAGFANEKQNPSNPYTEGLTKEQIVAYHSVKERVMQANPQLKAQWEAMRREYQSFKEKGIPPTTEQQQALAARKKQIEDAVQNEVLRQDPSLRPILERIQANLGAAGIVK